MKITAKSSGGFAGLARSITIDTARQPFESRQALEQMVNQVNFFDAGADQSPDAVGADMMRWQITVDDKGRTHTVGFVQDGSASSEAWNALLNRVLAAV